MFQASSVILRSNYIHYIHKATISNILFVKFPWLNLDNSKKNVKSPT